MTQAVSPKHPMLATLISEVLQRSPPDNALTRSMAEIRSITSNEKYPQADVDEIFDSGAASKMVAVLTSPDASPKLLLETIWIVTNLLASRKKQQVAQLLEVDVVNVLIRLVRTNKDNEIVKQTLWALGNLAGDGTGPRNTCLESGIAQALAEVTLETKLTDTERVANLAWVISNCCRGKPEPTFKSVKLLLITIMKLIGVKSDEAHADICWALSYIADIEGDDKGEASDAVSNVACDYLLHTIKTKSTNNNVLAPAIRAMGGILSRTEKGSLVAMGRGLLDTIHPLILSNECKKGVRKEMFWMISNVAAGTVSQRKALFKIDITSTIVRTLVDQKEAEDVKKEARWALLSLILNSSDDEIKTFNGRKLVPLLAKTLADNTNAAAYNCLEALVCLFSAFPDMQAAVLTECKEWEIVRHIGLGIAKCDDHAKTSCAKLLNLEAFRDISIDYPKDQRPEPYAIGNVIATNHDPHYGAEECKTEAKSDKTNGDT